MLAGCALVTAVLLRAAYQRKRPDRTPCETCPERSARVCSGLAPLLRRERAFQRWSRRLVNRGDGGRFPVMEMSSPRDQAPAVAALFGQPE